MAIAHRSRKTPRFTAAHNQETTSQNGSLDVRQPSESPAVLATQATQVLATQATRNGLKRRAAMGGSREMTTSQISARTAFLMTAASLAVLWIIQIINNADHYRLSYDFAIEPRIAADLPYIFTAPLLHWSWVHIQGNSIPFLVLGFLAAYRNSIPKFIGVTAVVITTSGMVEWLFAPTGSAGAGASGVIFGWFGYVIVRGFFTHNKVDIVVGIVIMIYYLPIFTLLLPAPHLGYQAHIGGLVGGVFCGWAFRNRPAAVDAPVGFQGPMEVVQSVPTSRSQRSENVEAELAALKNLLVDEGHRFDEKKTQ